MDGSCQRVLTKRGPLEKEWQTTSVFLPREPHEHYEKAKRYDTEPLSSSLIDTTEDQILSHTEHSY